ncbi:Flp family type IVb pilin [Dyella kyungheensis]|uniref:Flp family type IVb pilin n=1 Tax=Dyella kyungheensis TaxID=1242174 RepID=A0ABS2JX79_9GAMM|nr:Flp family type IVb pilin [Dyella kyungheensis]MBM7123617.1 Flp family type IVb pilin [Dyella kyungheensis]
MKTMIRNFLVEEDGITAIEYGILAAIVAAAVVAAFKTPLSQLFAKVFTALGTVVDGATS